MKGMKVIFLKCVTPPADGNWLLTKADVKLKGEDCVSGIPGQTSEGIPHIHARPSPLDKPRGSRLLLLVTLFGDLWSIMLKGVKWSYKLESCFYKGL